MAISTDELARLIITLEVSTTKMYNALRKAQTQTNTSATAIERRLTSMSTKIDRTFANLGQRLSANLTGPLAGIGAAFSTREIVRYADAWTSAGNQIRAASQIVGLQGRSLEGIRQIADDSRAAFEPTVTLYSRLLRSAGDVAESELEIARATEIVGKAFKAGGAEASEMRNGIIQLSQGLGSGLLQGDELRSVRENAPVLAKVIADYFGVTVAGLKELGSQGKLTSEEIFRAILSGGKEVEAAFNTTNRTIGDSFRLVENALIQYIGSADQSAGATAALTIGLTALADNFDVAADIALKLASILAGALIGRGIIGLVSGFTAGAAAISTLVTSMRTATTTAALFSAAAGPLALLIGGTAALAFQHLASEALNASAQTKAINAEIDELGIVSSKASEGLLKSAEATKKLADETDRLAIAEEKRKNAQIRENLDFLRSGNISSELFQGFKGNEDLETLPQILTRAKAEMVGFFNTANDRAAYQNIARLAGLFREGQIDAEGLRSKLLEIASTDVSKSVIDLLESFNRVANEIENREILLTVRGEDTQVLDDANQKVIDLLERLSLAANLSGDFEYRDGVDDLIDKLEEGEIASAETLEFLNNLTSAKGDFTELLSGIALVIAEVIRLGQEADATRSKTDELRQAANNEQRFAGSDPSTSKNPFSANNSFFAGQSDNLNKTKQQRDLLKEIAEVEKEIIAAGGTTINQEEKITELATKRLAQKEADKKKGKESETDQKKFFKSLDEQTRSNELLAAEAEFMKTLNPLAKEYTQQLAAWKYEQELLNDALEAEVEITPAVEEAIKKVAAARAEGDEALRNQQRAQEDLITSTQEWFDLAKSATRSFIDDLIEGKTATEALGGALKQLGSHLINAGLGGLFGTGGGNFGVFGQLFGLPGRAAGGPVTAGQPYIVGEKRPEIFVPNQSGVIIPKVPNQINANNTSSGVNVPIQISIDATGADSAAAANMQQGINRLRDELPYLIRSEVAKRQKKGW